MLDERELEDKTLLSRIEKLEAEIKIIKAALIEMEERLEKLEKAN